MSIQLTVDVAVLCGNKILLIRRNKEPFTEKLVLPGGHMEEIDRSLAAAASRELYEETGLEISERKMRYLMVLDSPNRDPRGRKVSFVFTISISAKRFKSARAGSDAKSVTMVDLDDIHQQQTGFDHWKVVKALKGARKMKIIEKGKWSMPWSKEYVCSERSCEAKLLVEESDVHPVDYSSKYAYYFACLVCGAHVDVSASDLPKRIKDALDKKRKQSTYDCRD